MMRRSIGYFFHHVRKKRGGGQKWERYEYMASCFIFERVVENALRVVMETELPRKDRGVWRLSHLLRPLQYKKVLKNLTSYDPMPCSSINT